MWFEWVQKVHTLRLCCSLARSGMRAPCVQARQHFSKRIVLAARMSTKAHGLRGLYAGMAPNALQVLPSSALGYFVYEMMKVALDVRE